MNHLKHKKLNAQRRTHRVRSRVIGVPERPRLSVSISNQHITAQVIDDSRGITLAYASSVGQKKDGGMSEKASWVGEEIARKAKQAKVKRVVFDRNRHKYHGRIKTLAESARQSGLEF